MKRIILSAIFLLTSTAALAMGNGPQFGGNATAISGAISGSKAVSNSSASANSNSSSYSGANAYQHQGQYQSQNQGQVLLNKNGSSSNNNGGNVAITHRKNLRNAPSFGLPAAFPTAVCQGTVAAGFSFWLGGGAAAGTITIEECMKLETIRVGTIMLQNAVDTEAAKAQEKANTEVFCMTKYGAQTALCPKPVQEAKGETVPAVAVVAPKKVAGIPDVRKENNATVFDDIGSLLN